MKINYLLIITALFTIFLIGCQTTSQKVEESGAETSLSNNNAESNYQELSRNEKKEIQSRLAKLGFEPGLADGIIGKRTSAAISAYQKESGLSVNGKASLPLLVSLRATENQDSSNSIPSAENVSQERKFTTEDSDRSPIVVYYKVIPKIQLDKLLKCEKALNKKRRENGLRTIEVATSNARFVGTSFTHFGTDVSLGDSDVHAARLELDFCLSGSYGDQLKLE